MAMQTIEETWSGAKPWNIEGRFFKIMATVNPVDVVLIDPDGTVQKALQVEAGFKFVGSFKRIEITTAANEKVKFVISDGDAGDDRVISIAPRTVKFSTSGSYVVPADVTLLKVIGIGPGGGGGGGHTAVGGGGGGGGGSSLPMTQFIAVTPGETLLITIPAGGVGGVAGSDATAVTSNLVIRRTVGGTAIFAVPSGAGGSKGTVTNGGAGGACGTTTVIGAGGATGVGAGANGTGVAAVDTGLWRIHGGGGGGAGGGPSSAGGNGGHPWGSLANSFTLMGGSGGAASGTDGGGGGGGACAFSRSGRANVGEAGETGWGYGAGAGGGSCTKAGGNGGDAYMIIEAQ